MVAIPFELCNRIIEHLNDYSETVNPQKKGNVESSRDELIQWVVHMWKTTRPEKKIPTLPAEESE